jgi:hypothetical protein
MCGAWKRFHRPAAITLALAGLAIVALLASRDTRPRTTSRPLVWVWAWERFDDLRFLDPRAAGVAYLAATVRLDSSGASWSGRGQGLRVAAGTRLLPVVRIEGTALLDDVSRRALARRLADVARQQGNAGLQIDWDAPRSLRPAYRELLADVRASLADSLPLSVTALASWCTGDCWLDGAPVDEIVPMVFRMGADDRSVRYDLARRGDFACRACREAVGLSTDEGEWPRLSKRRIYLFHPGPWTSAEFERALARLEPSRAR